MQGHEQSEVGHEVQYMAGQGAQCETQGDTDQHPNCVTPISISHYHRLVGEPETAMNHSFGTPKDDQELIRGLKSSNIDDSVGKLRNSLSITPSNNFP